MTTTFITPPANQGQIVDVSYAYVEGYVIRRSHDLSDRATKYWISRALATDEADYYNGAPSNKRWRAITEAEADRWMLADEY